MDAFMDACMHGWTDGWMHDRLHACMHACMLVAAQPSDQPGVKWALLPTRFEKQRVTDVFRVPFVVPAPKAPRGFGKGSGNTI